MIWTDFFQTILMVCGAFIVMSFAMVEVGGYDAMLTKLVNIFTNTILTKPNNFGYFNFLKLKINLFNCKS